MASTTGTPRVTHVVWICRCCGLRLRLHAQGLPPTAVMGGDYPANIARMADWLCAPQSGPAALLVHHAHLRGAVHGGTPYLHLRAGWYAYSSVPAALQEVERAEDGSCTRCAMVERDLDAVLERVD